MVSALDSLWLIPLFPLIGAAVALLLATFAPGRGKALVSVLCPGTVLLSFIASVSAVAALAKEAARAHQVIFAPWLPSIGAEWGIYLDPLSAVMILIITGIGFLIHLYSVGYMAHEGGYARYFGCLNLFVFFMLLLVMANNYALLFAGWEGVGLCSYLLIGFFYRKHAAAAAGMKAFIVNRVGDAGLLLAILTTFAAFGTIRFAEVAKAPAGGASMTLLALLLFAGAAGKSAQVPLHVWLPDAMEGPTPVSALIHAATMVTAGVYLISRSSAIFSLSPDASAVVAAVGAFTAIFAATIALVQNDIKKVLAYSTISQLGYMFLALGTGAWWVAIFHLFTHAFFKALLFLGAGSVIHALDGEQDLRHMGGLKKALPVTHATMFIAAVAISGIPGLAGFFSKDAILAEAFRSGSTALYVVGLTTAGLTAFYMWRLMHLAFYGERARHASAHEGPWTMRVPLIALAAGSALAGWIGVPEQWYTPAVFRAFPLWIAPVFHQAAHAPAGTPMEWVLMGASAAVALIGVTLARYFYHHRPAMPASFEQSLKPLHGILLNKWYVDEFYERLFVSGLAKGGGRLLSHFDSGVVDGGVNGTAWLTRLSGRVSVWWDEWVVDGAITLGAYFVKLLSYPARLLQNGHLQSYALIFAMGMVALFSVYVFSR